MYFTTKGIPTPLGIKCQEDEINYVKKNLEQIKLEKAALVCFSNLISDHKVSRS